MKDILKEILSDIQQACISISQEIRYSDSLDLSVINNTYNKSGDNVKKLDLISNDILKHRLIKCKHLRMIASEEENYLIPCEGFLKGKYLICFDPLDGSSNISVNITTGTIFAVYEYNKDKIQSGRNIVMAGYCLYGGSTQLVVAHKTVDIYSLEKDGFKKTHNDWKIPNQGKYYAINESNKHIFLDQKYNQIIETLIRLGYSSRWVGSMVADGHRTLIKGGFFSYPGNKNNREGKIRLLYEAYPFAYIFEIAGGESSNGEINILDIPFPEKIHQKTPIILSSKMEFEL
jgi:fructose-1,6-bisphosphatase I